MDGPGSHEHRRRGLSLLLCASLCVFSLCFSVSLSLSLSLSLYLVSQAIQSGSVRFSWPAHLARPALYTCIPSAGESRDAIRRRSEGL